MSAALKRRFWLVWFALVERQFLWAAKMVAAEFVRFGLSQGNGAFLRL